MQQRCVCDNKLFISRAPLSADLSAPVAVVSSTSILKYGYPSYLLPQGVCKKVNEIHFQYPQGKRNKKIYNKGIGMNIFP